MKPELSVIIPAPGGAATVQAALDAWDGQVGRQRIELLLLCPDAATGGVGLVRTIPTDALLLHEARARAVRAARADHVLLAEDHCLPERGSLESILARIAEGCDLVGPAMRPGCPTAPALASFLLGYGEWMGAVGSGPAPVLPGHSVVIRRQLLLELGGELEDELVMCFLMHRRFRAEGRRFFTEARWRMVHYDPPGLARSLAVFWHVGLGTGASRTRRWPAPLRLLYPLALPAAAGRHWLRGALQYARAGRAVRMPAGSLAVAALYAAVSGAGEAAGALLGLRRVAPLVARCEIKPVSPEAVERYAAAENRVRPNGGAEAQGAH